MEMSEGRVLYSKNEHAIRYPASTTKILTALVVIESCDLSQTVTIPAEAQGVEGSSIYLKKGEKLTVLELLYGLMLRSGNDAATALALHCGGTISGFAEMMNQKASSLGCTSSHFVNPSGLPSPEHYTTAFDLALIARAAMQNDTFARIVSTKKISIPWEGMEHDRILINENKMLYNYDGANGIKTGYTIAAGRCLVSSAERDGMTLIAVVLGCRPMYEECSAMLDHGFENYELKKIISQNDHSGVINVTDGFDDWLNYAVKDEFYYPLSQNDTVNIKKQMYSTEYPAPVNIGDEVGVLTVFINGDKIKSIPLVTTRGTNRNTFIERLKTLFRIFLSI
ncbi:MAG: D-alanyl-D-alanine carboxypeptidase [Clostridiales bacterium]|nr:D-alanyl-D-alanine carboxypeptidase [Clostridiales bacterium]